MSFLNPVNGTYCHLMPEALGLAEWSQSVQASQCTMSNVYTAPFAAIGQNRWKGLPSTTETGSQFSITFNQYQTQVEVIQQGVAPFSARD
jgi:hypothetical protein